MEPVERDGATQTDASISIEFVVMHSLSLIGTEFNVILNSTITV